MKSLFLSLFAATIAMTAQAQTACPSGDVLLEKLEAAKSGSGYTEEAALGILVWAEQGKSGLETKHHLAIRAIMNCYWGDTCGLDEDEALGDSIRLSLLPIYDFRGKPTQPMKPLPDRMPDTPPANAVAKAEAKLKCGTGGESRSNREIARDDAITMAFEDATQAKARGDKPAALVAYKEACDLKSSEACYQAAQTRILIESGTSNFGTYLDEMDVRYRKIGDAKRKVSNVYNTTCSPFTCSYPSEEETALAEQGMPQHDEAYAFAKAGCEASYDMRDHYEACELAGDMIRLGLTSTRRPSTRDTMWSSACSFAPEAEQGKVCHRIAMKKVAVFQEDNTALRTYFASPRPQRAYITSVKEHDLARGFIYNCIKRNYHTSCDYVDGFIIAGNAAARANIDKIREEVRSQ